MLVDKLTEYVNRFGDGFPMCPLAWSRSDDEIIAIIDRCLSENKTVYKLGYLQDSDEEY